MQLRQLTDIPCGLRFMIDDLEIHSGYARRLLLDSEMCKDRNVLEHEYSVLSAFYDAVSSSENRISVDTLMFKLCNLKDLAGTFRSLRNKSVLNEIELFEVKYLAILSAEIKSVMRELHLDEYVHIPDLAEVVSLLDPDGLRIASFYIYDSYSDRLKYLRGIMKNSETVDEDVFNEIAEIEDEIRGHLSASLQQYADALHDAQKALAIIDLNIAKARQMTKMGLCFPSVEDDKTWYEGMFNPEVKAILNKNNKDYQAVDICLGKMPTIITGANMGGKTVVIKTLALCQFLFQFAMGIPSKRAGIMLQNDVFCCFTDEQSVEKGLSSFAAEMHNIDAIIKASRKESRFLALVDEPARTTNPTEGTALVSALVKLLQDKDLSLVIVTHYNIKTFNSRCLRVTGFENGKMNYRLVEAKEGDVPHEALNIAEALGVDEEWIADAKMLLDDEYNGNTINKI